MSLPSPPAATTTPPAARTPLRSAVGSRHHPAGPPRRTGVLPRPAVLRGGHPLALPHPGLRRRPVLPRRRGTLVRLAGRPATAPVLPGPQRLLQGARPPSRRGLAAADARDRPPPAQPHAGSLAVAGPPAQSRRRLHGVPAGHRSQPVAIPPTQLPEAGSGLPRRPPGRAVLADRRHRPGRRPGALPGQADR